MEQKSSKELLAEMAELDKKIAEAKPKTRGRATMKSNVLANVVGQLTGKKTASSISKSVLQKINPMGIVKSMEDTVGEKPTVSKVLGGSQSRRSKKDPLELNIVRTRVDNIRPGENLTDSLGKLYTLYKKIDEEDRTLRELEKNFQHQQKDKEDKRHKEILDALKGDVKDEEEKEDDIVGKIRKTASKYKKSTKKKDTKSDFSAVDVVPAMIGGTFGGMGNLPSTGPSIPGAPKVEVGSSQQRTDWQKRVYNAFANAGFSKNQAIALTAEVGRENEFNPTYMFGTHSEDASHAKGRENVGILSFAAERNTNLRKWMKDRGLVEKGKNGEEVFVKSQDSLNAQAAFIRDEMETKYPTVKKEFLDNPNISKEEAERVLGKKYIAWAIDNPKYRESGLERKNRAYAQVESFVNTGQTAPSVVTAVAPDAERPKQTATKIQNPEMNADEERAPNSNVVAIGDSLAVGIIKHNNIGGLAKGGSGTKSVLSMIQKYHSKYDLKGKMVILGTGAPNSKKDIGVVNDQIKYLKEIGATPLILGAGPGGKVKWKDGSWHDVDLTGVSEQLQQIAASHNVRFSGHLASLDPTMVTKGDGIHMTDSGYRSAYNALVGSSAKAETSNEKKVGQTLNTASTENKDLKQSLEKKESNVLIAQNQTNIIKQGNKSVVFVQPNNKVNLSPVALAQMGLK